VLPSGILLLDVCILVIMAVNFRNWQSYMILQLLMILISVVPVVLLAVGIVDVPYPAVAAMAVSVFIFLGTLIIGDDRARTELKRRFHI
jgi:ABC-type transport system involved in cytochrome bd biosynthesis fused ATPase/permease subunit